MKIDNQHDPFATVVSIQYGNKLGELLDTVGLAASLLSQREGTAFGTYSPLALAAYHALL